MGKGVHWSRSVFHASCHEDVAGTFITGCSFDTYVFITQMMLSPQHY
jgi:hypothetical protein